MVWKVCYAETADTYPGIVARNLVVLEYEKFIHRTFYPCIIHPYSRFRVNWQKAFLGFIFVRLTFTTFFFVVLRHTSLGYQGFMLVFQILSFADTVLNFFTGYVDNKTEAAVLDPKKIAKKYLLTYFIFDFLPSIPLQFFLLFTDKGHCDNFFLDSQQEHYNSLFYFFMLLSYLRFFSFLRYLDNLSKILLWNPFLIGLINVCHTLYIWIVICIPLSVFFLNEENDSSIFPKNSGKYAIVYVELFVLTVLDCLYYDTTDYDSTNPLATSFIRSLILTVSLFVSMTFMAYFIKYSLLKMQAQEKFLDLESRVLSFVRKRHLPSSLAKKTLLYFQILLENKYCREDEIFNYIPDTFKAEIFFHLCLPLLKNFYPFEDLPKYVLRRIAECLKYQLYLPNEVILSLSNPTLSMYFIHRGTAALYSAKNVELYHFEGGSSFNGRTLIMGEARTTHYAISIEVTEVYRLEHEDFIEIMQTYPNLLKVIQKKFNEDKTGSTCLLE